MHPLTYRTILGIALPIIAANAIIPLQGLVDTAIAGRFGRVDSLAAVGLMAEFWGLAIGSLNFLQYATSGQSAQLLGKANHTGIQQTLIRALLLASIMGVFIMLFQRPVYALSQVIFQPDAVIATEMQRYFHVRVFGIIAELGNYALIGWFAGQGLSRLLLLHQAVLTCVNVMTTLIFTQYWTFGIAGLAMGTVCGHIAALLVGLMLANRHLKKHNCTLTTITANTFALEKLRELLSLNANLFVRTLLLSLCFIWLMRLSVQIGTAEAATMTVVLWLLTIASFSLDGVAVATESLCGQAIGAKNRSRFNLVIKKTWRLNTCIAIAISIFYALIYLHFIRAMTPLSHLHVLAESIKIWVVLLPIVAVSGYVLDGVYFAATAGKHIRNAMLLVTVITLPCAWLTAHFFGLTGVCIGFWVFFVARGLIFGLMLPKLIKRTF